MLSSFPPNGRCMPPAAGAAARPPVLLGYQAAPAGLFAPWRASRPRLMPEQHAARPCGRCCSMAELPLLAGTLQAPFPPPADVLTTHEAPMSGLRGRGWTRERPEQLQGVWAGSCSSAGASKGRTRGPSHHSAPNARPPTTSRSSCAHSPPPPLPTSTTVQLLLGRPSPLPSLDTSSLRSPKP